MRLADGLDIDHLHATTGGGVDPDGLARMMRQGVVDQAGPRIRLTAAGRLLADGVSGELVP
jgi:coproporphyrinogen III oxidase-like Fe-S oxidoreductase